MIVFERRASSILFGVLQACPNRRPFLLPGNVCHILPRTYSAAARQFELVDISPEWLSMDEDKCLARVRSGQFAGVHFVRAYGCEREPTAFFAELRALQPELLIIDDRCLCRPDCAGHSVSPFADVSLFSTGSAKVADLGGGGFAHLGDEVLYRRPARAPEWLETRPPAWSWDKYRDLVEDVTARSLAHKSSLNEIYSHLIPPELQYQDDLQQWRFNIRVRNADQLIATIFNEGLFASRHYAAIGDCKVAHTVHGQIVNLFNDPHCTAEQAVRTAEIVAKHVGARR